VSLLERLLFLALGLLIVATLVLLVRHDIGRNAAPHHPPSSVDGGFWRR
jgi:hypothetical protein